ncbi:MULTISPECIES: threonine/serine exporter family protein [unclassified Paenibacillus]|uniref:threonine/serine exporter family protein n=1 Tax=unclassified Paenibacillus TaxID=185978 RepID=UPI002F418511
MDIILKLLMSFIATSAFGLIFNVPLRLLPICGTVGMGGWLVFIAGEEWLGLNPIAAVMLAAFCVTAISQIFARLLKTPIILFNVSGIIPLVPGRLAYNAMRNVVEDQYDIALQLGTQVLLISGAIAIGLVLSEVVHQFIRKAAR